MNCPQWANLRQKSRSEVAQGWEGSGTEKGVTSNRYGGFSGGEENGLKSMVVSIAQLCKYSKNHWVVYFKQVTSP